MHFTNAWLFAHRSPTDRPQIVQQIAHTDRPQIAHSEWHRLPTVHRSPTARPQVTIRIAHGSQPQSLYVNVETHLTPLNFNLTVFNYVKLNVK